MNIKQKLIDAGVRNIMEFGYPHVNANNILTDMVYAGFFLSMLRDNLGSGFDKQINELIEECEKAAP